MIPGIEFLIYEVAKDRLLICWLGAHDRFKAYWEGEGLEMTATMRRGWRPEKSDNFIYIGEL